MSWKESAFLAGKPDQCFSITSELKLSKYISEAWSFLPIWKLVLASQENSFRRYTKHHRGCLRCPPFREARGHHEPSSGPGGGRHGSSASPNLHLLKPNAASGFSLRRPIPVLRRELRLHHPECAALHNSMKLLNRSRCSTPFLTRSQDPEEIQFPSAKSTVSNSCEYPLYPL